MDRWETPQTVHPVAVETVSSADGFAGLAPDWERLHAAAESASVFTSWLWLHRWWLHYGKEQPLRILVARVRGETVGILPLYVQAQRVLGRTVNVLRLIGSGGDTHPDDLGAVLAPGREPATALALAEAAVRLNGWDVMCITDMDPGCHLPAALECASTGAGLPTEAGISQKIAYIDLPQNWPAFLESLSGSRRARLKKARNRLEKARSARFYAWDEPARLDAAIDRLIALHHLRWAQAGGSESFKSPEYIAFHRSVIKACAERGWLRLYCQEIEGEIVAMTYCYRFRNRVFLVQAGMDPAHASWKPGNVLLGNAIEHAIAEGNQVMDFLRGDHRYKEELASGMRDTVYVAAFRSNPGAWAYRTRQMYWPKFKSKIRSLLGRT